MYFLYKKRLEFESGQKFQGLTFTQYKRQSTETW